MPKNVYDGIEEILALQKEEKDKQKEILALLKEDKERSIKEHDELLATIKKSSEKSEIVRAGNYRSPNQIFQSFLKRATQELVYFDEKEEFYRKKKVCLILILVSIGLMLLCSIVATAAFGLYSTFTLFENIWLFLMLFILRYTLKTKRVYSTLDYEHYNFLDPDRGKFSILGSGEIKGKYKWFFIIACISFASNILCICTNPYQAQFFVTLLELSCLVINIVTSVFVTRFFGGYHDIIKLTGMNEACTSEVVIYWVESMEKLYSEEEFAKAFPLLCES